MNLSRLFILRPVATTLITLGVALAGAIAFFLLPVSPLPQVEFPTISVQAQLPGASPETMAATVATPLERALGSIAGVTEITSSSSLGSTRITLQFDFGREIDSAARDVQAAINASRSMLPSGMPSNPTYRKVNPADAPIMIVALTSATLSRGQMYDAASTVLAQRLSQVEGVGQVTVGGGALPAVRIEVDPTKLASAGVALDALRAAVVATNANRPKGVVEDATRAWQVEANDQAKRAEDYAPLVVAWKNGAALRLRDVAQVIDSVQDLRNDGLSSSKPAVLLIVSKAPGANILETVDAVRALLPRLRSAIPAAIDVDVVMDRTPTIRASIREVEHTLLISFVLVVAVVLVFLRDLRAAALPAVAVPVSLAGTAAVMWLLGYSVDNLSLMALTVATGFVVDDAIVVLENIARHVERGMAPRAAALQGAREIGFTVVSISVSLVAVFIPILAMGGIVGRLFREFAVVLSVAIAVSMVVSLTTTPMMAAVLLRRREPARRRGRVAAALEAAQAGLTRGYRTSLRVVLRHQPLTLALLAGVIGLNVWLYATIAKGFFPQQDTGLIVGGVQADQASSFQSMQAKLREFSAIVTADPAVAGATGFTGGGQRNSANMFIALKPRPERTDSAEQVVARLRGKLSRIAGASLFLTPAQDIRVGGRQANASWQYTLRADELDELRAWEPRIRRALAALPELADVSSDQQDRGLQTTLAIDRDALARLGLTMAAVDATLGDAFSQRQVGVIYNPLNQYRVVLGLSQQYTQSPETLKLLTFTNAEGEQVPLAAFATTQLTNTALAVSHQGGGPATTVAFNLAPDVPLSQAVAAVDRAMQSIGVPSTIRGNFQGTAKAFQDSLASQPWLILAAIVTIYLVLGILYESLIHPVTILSTLPSAGVGALLALMAFRTDFSIIALIGVVLLIGIVKKNAIMMLDFAISAQREADARGVPLAAGPAIYRAASLRLRPILMTTAAALFGAVPLALGRGDGAELRQPLGIAIVGGLALSQLLTLYTTPVVFAVMDRLRRRNPGAAARRAAAAAGAAAVVATVSGCAGLDALRPPPAPQAPAAPAVPPRFKQLDGWKRAAAVDAVLGPQPGDTVSGAEGVAGPRRRATGASDTTHTVADAVPDAWWRLFGDPVLDDLESRLIVGNETLRGLAAQVAAAQAAVDASRAALWPRVSVSVDTSRTGSPNAAGARSTSGSASLGANASWEIDLWGRLRSAERVVDAQLQASRDDWAAARLAAQATLAQTYFAMRAAEAQRALLERTVEALARAVTLTEARYRAGVVARADVIQAQSQLRSVEVQRREAQLSRTQLEHAIATLLGVPPSALALAETARLAEAPAVPEVLPATLLERRPDIAAAERRVAAAWAQIGVADAAWFPTISLSAGLGAQASRLAALASAPGLVWSIGAALVEPLLDGGQRRLASTQARAAAEQAGASYRQAALVAFQEVEDNLAAVAALADERPLQAEAVAAAERLLQITTVQYRAGTVSYLNVVNAQTAVLAAQQTLLSIRARQLAAVNTLLKNVAGRWDAAAPVASPSVGPVPPDASPRRAGG